MKKYLFSLLAIAIAFFAVSFTVKSTEVKSDAQSFTYFKFVGTPGVNENDVTKWEEITAAIYNDDDPLTAIVYCPSTQRGCKLKTTATQLVSGILRPSIVYTQSVGSPAHLNPITGTLVPEVKNKQAN